MNSVRIFAPGGTGRHMKVYVNGEEVKYVTGVAVEVAPNRFTEVTLTFLADVVADVETVSVKREAWTGNGDTPRPEGE